MKEYTYYFADGTQNTIEVEDKWYDVLKEMDEKERKQKYNYDRHNIALSLMDYEGEAFADPNGDPFDILMNRDMRKKLNSALATLTECQRELFEKSFIERKKVAEIAEEEGVCHQAISQRLERIKNKLQKFLI